VAASAHRFSTNKAEQLRESANKHDKGRFPSPIAGDRASSALFVFCRALLQPKAAPFFGLSAVAGRLFCDRLAVEEW
jgi:hypothetical protein